SLRSRLHFPSPPRPHSFPTRRSSDLQPFSSTASEKFFAAPATPEPLRTSTVIESSATLTSLSLGEGSAEVDSEASEAGGSASERSEEHTSELQSRFDLVCRLLLEKKK